MWLAQATARKQGQCWVVRREFREQSDRGNFELPDGGFAHCWFLCCWRSGFGNVFWQYGLRRHLLEHGSRWNLLDYGSRGHFRKCGVTADRGHFPSRSWTALTRQHTVRYVSYPSSSCVRRTLSRWRTTTRFLYLLRPGCCDRWCENVRFQEICFDLVPLAPAKDLFAASLWLLGRALLSTGRCGRCAHTVWGRDPTICSLFLRWLSLNASRRLCSLFGGLPRCLEPCW